MYNLLSNQLQSRIVDTSNSSQKYFSRLNITTGSLKPRPCPFIQILSRFYLDFITILSQFYPDKIRIKSG